MTERNFWQEVPAALGMSSPSYNPRTSGPSVPRNFRVEWPAWNESVCFEHEYDALKYGRIWSAEDHALVLVWSFASGMYIQRYDGRGR